MKLIQHKMGERLFVDFGYAFLGIVGGISGMAIHEMLGHGHSHWGFASGLVVGFICAFLLFDVDWTRKERE